MKNIESKTLVMRELNGGDVFSILGIVNTLDCYDEVMQIIKEMQEETAKIQNELIERLKSNGIKFEDITSDMLEEQEEARALKLGLGTKVFKVVAKHLPKIKKELNEFLGELTGTTAQVINDLSIVEYVKLVMAFFQKKELSNISQSVMLLMTEED